MAKQQQIVSTTVSTKPHVVTSSAPWHKKEKEHFFEDEDMPAKPGVKRFLGNANKCLDGCTSKSNSGFDVGMVGPFAKSARVGTIQKSTTIGGTRAGASTGYDTTDGEVPYKYQEVVRKKEDRKRLRAYTCKACEKFYEANQTWERLPSQAHDDAQCTCDMLQDSGRHRARHEPPPTPEGFWSFDF